jgi:hypothetical protein
MFFMNVIVSSFGSKPHSLTLSVFDCMGDVWVYRAVFDDGVDVFFELPAESEVWVVVGEAVSVRGGLDV